MEEQEVKITRPRNRADLNEEQLAELCKALGHPARVKIIRHLLEHGQCVCGSIVKVLPLAQSTVSQHLKVLRDKRIVAVAREGTFARYRLTQPKILAAMKLMREAFLECLGEERLLRVVADEGGSHE